MDTRELFARLIQCEAGGEGDDGMRARSDGGNEQSHHNLRRVRQNKRRGNIRNIIEQENQFTCMKTSVGGYYNSQNVYNMTPTDVHYEIVDWALAGGRLAGVDNSLFFSIPTARRVPHTFLLAWESYTTESEITASIYRRDITN